ncbi:MAG TPA: hypothetical protein VGG39_15535 [Polyangiaceae bacterium]|jgi:hypothetical protein
MLARTFTRPWLLAVLAPALAGGLALLTGCSPHVGSKCTLNTDCSLQGTLVCDNSQPYGYCTSFNCAPDTCQNKAACVLMSPAVPGCPYDDYDSPDRTGRSMCLEQCHKDSDCRTNEGYVCADPRQPPWNALIIDDDQSQLVCIVRPTAVSSDAGDASSSNGTVSALCQAYGPTVPSIDAGQTYTPDAGSDGAVSSDGAALDALASDAAADAAEAGVAEGSAGDATVADAGESDAADAGDAGANDATGTGDAAGD